MLLKELTLQNIRSYQNQTIRFPEGTTLLSGDIGSGKSTILLAIEFALFGTSRPDLPAELLLRNGSMQGKVELTFLVEGKEITIQRSLKREKSGIKQLPGYIINNNSKKELMPIELKAEALAILGYPEEYLLKNKNYIFRYTIYTPQEEMKLILQEDADIRLDVLRKIFNVDKYKVIRENVQVYLKQLRARLSTFQVLIEPLPKLEEQYSSIIAEKEHAEKIIAELTPQHQSVARNVALLQEELSALEEQHQKNSELQAQHATFLALLAQKQNILQAIMLKQTKLKEEMNSLPLETVSREKIQQDIEELEQRKISLLTTKTQLMERLKQIKQLIQEHRLFLEGATKEINSMSEKEQLLPTLEQEILQKATLQEKKGQLESISEKIITGITKNQTILQQSKETMEKMSNLNVCPTCLQDVSEEHKQHILTEESERSTQAEALLREFNIKRTTILAQKEEVNTALNSIFFKENFLVRIQTELAQLKERQQRVLETQNQMEFLKAESDQLESDLQQYTATWPEEDLSKKMSELHLLREYIIRRELFEKQSKDLQHQQELEQQEIHSLHHQIILLEESIPKETLLPKIVEKKNELSAAQQQEKEISIHLAELHAMLKNILLQENEVMQRITGLKAYKNSFTRTQEIYYWLDEHFLNLTATIEKQVMAAIYMLFNQLFQEWFSILIDEENVSSRLDDSFTPIIEQNGYELFFQNLSGGEKTSAALSYRLALNKVINDVISQIKTKDVLILDEPTDGFSAEQLDKVREVLERLHLRQTIIVSHETKIESFVENIIRIAKEGHVSTVTQ